MNKISDVTTCEKKDCFEFSKKCLTNENAYGLSDVCFLPRHAKDYKKRCDEVYLLNLDKL